MNSSDYIEAQRVSLPDCMMPEGAEPCIAFQRVQAERDRLMAINGELRTSLFNMECGYRERCNYCGGDVRICDSAPKGGCRAPRARAAISRAMTAATP